MYPQRYIDHDMVTVVEGASPECLRARLSSPFLAPPWILRWLLVLLSHPPIRLHHVFVEASLFARCFSSRVRFQSFSRKTGQFLFLEKLAWISCHYPPICTFPLCATRRSPYSILCWPNTLGTPGYVFPLHEFPRGTPLKGLGPSLPPPFSPSFQQSFLCPKVIQFSDNL